jgi:hypothetical protein
MCLAWQRALNTCGRSFFCGTDGLVLHQSWSIIDTTALPSSNTRIGRNGCENAIRSRLTNGIKGYMSAMVGSWIRGGRLGRQCIDSVRAKRRNRHLKVDAVYHTGAVVVAGSDGARKKVLSSRALGNSRYCTFGRRWIAAMPIAHTFFLCWESGRHLTRVRSELQLLLPPATGMGKRVAVRLEERLPEHFWWSCLSSCS